MKYLFPILLLCSQAHALLQPERIKKVSKDLQTLADSGGDRLGYADWMLQYLAIEGGENFDGARIRPTINPFDLFSGALAIRESLQVDTIREGKDDKATIDIKTLKGPVVKSHPFEKMLKGRESKTFSLDAAIPPDWFYAHFSSMTRALDIADYLNQTGGAFYNRFSAAPVDTALKKRILSQLAVVENKDARMFYDAVIDEMAIVSSDFFFAMGTDISLLFRLKQKAIFESTIKTYRGSFLKLFPDAKSEQITVAGKAVNFISTPDMRLRSYLYIDGDNAIISNSPIAIARLIELSQKNGPSLATTDEYRYMRSVYKADANNEDGFIYFSDAFIRNLVSPKLRIGEARRIGLAHKLAKLEKLVLLHQHAYGKTAQSLDELLANTATDEKVLKGAKESFVGFRIKDFRAFHPELGSLGYLKPNLELPLTKISPEESEGYIRFIENYSSFWRDYFDPIGIRIKKKDSGIKIDICILPLIENSIYNRVTEFMGGKPPTHTVTTMPGETLSIAAKINMDSSKNLQLRKMDEELLDSFSGKIQVHGLDSYPNIDFNPEILFSEMMRGRLRSEAMFGVLAWSLFHPLRVSLDMKNTAGAQAFLDNARATHKYESRRRMYSAYDYEYGGKKITVFVMDFFRIVTFRLHAWTDGGTIHVTSTRDYAEKYIDAKKETATHKGNMVMLYRPKEVTREKPAIVQSNGESMERGCLANLGTIKLAAIVFPGEDALSALEKRYSLKPVCPAGGKYEQHGGNPTHSIFGTKANTHNDFRRVEEVMKDYFSTEEFKLQFEFTPEGIMTSIETK